MTRPRPFVRFLALLWASLQVASPGAAAIADALASSRGGWAAASHVEATTTSSCPEVHGVDCGICRLLSNSATAAPASPGWYELAIEVPAPALERCAPRLASHPLPHGRAPPGI